MRGKYTADKPIELIITLEVITPVFCIFRLLSSKILHPKLSYVAKYGH